MHRDRPEIPGDVGRLAELLTSRGWKTTVHDEDVRVSAPASQAADVNRAAAEAGITLSALRPHEASLEEVFLRMTGDESGDNGRPQRADREAGGRVMIRAIRCELTRLRTRPSSSAALA